MSWPCMNWAYQVPDLSCSAKAVLVNLAFRAGPDGKSWPRVERICRDVSLGERTVQGALKDLAAAGLIRIQERRMQTSVYHLNCPSLLQVDKDDAPGGPKEAEIAAGETPQNLRGGAQSTTLFDGLTPQSTTSDPAVYDSFGAQNLLPNNKKNIHKEESKKNQSLVEIEFEEFWERYPNKVGKKPAKEKYLMARKRFFNATIMAGLEAHLPSFATKEPQYIPHAATWLHQERFNDPAPAPAHGANGFHAMVKDRIGHIEAGHQQKPNRFLPGGQK